MEMPLKTRSAHREGFRLTAEALGRGRRGGGGQVEAHRHLRSLAVVPVMAGSEQPGFNRPDLVTGAQIEAPRAWTGGKPALAPTRTVSAFGPGEASEMPATRDGGVPQRAEGMQQRAVGSQMRSDSAAPGEWEAAGVIGGRAPEAGRMRVLVRAPDAPRGGSQGHEAHSQLRAGAAGQGVVRASGEGTSAPPEGVRGLGVSAEQSRRGRVQEVGFEELLARLARRERLEFAR